MVSDILYLPSLDFGDLNMVSWSGNGSRFSGAEQIIVFLPNKWMLLHPKMKFKPLQTLLLRG